MRLLLDTHIVLAIVDQQLSSRYPKYAAVIEAEGTSLSVSVATIWEIAIKSRLSKLKPRLPPDMLAEHLNILDIAVLDITAAHATARIDPDIPTRDPFDRLLVATAQLEGMRLMTVDRALADHPVTFR